MWNRLKKWYTLRNQILIIFLSVMIIVLGIVSAITLRQVSSLVKDNAEDQIRQTAIQTSGRIDSLFEQLNTATKFIITNPNVQDIYERTYRGEKIPFQELQKLSNVVNNIQANSEGIYSVELYTNNLERLLPLDDSSKMFNRVNVKWIDEANHARGRLIWMGEDPKNNQYFLALRRVSLMNQKFNNAGYLLISINKKYFEITEKSNQKQYSFLLDGSFVPLFSNFPGYINLNKVEDKPITKIEDTEYMVTKETSNETGFTVLILTPVSELTKGLSGIRMGIILSGIVGIIIYFIFSLMISNRITKPIVNLTNTMRQANKGLMTINQEDVTVNEITELNSTYNQLVTETNHLIKMIYQKEIIRSQSELKALQAQINPHFLYNTLDSLHWSLEDKGEEELADIVVAMSNLFRYTISKNFDDDWALIKQEFNHIENYLGIIKFRFGDRIQWKLHLPQNLTNIKIPKLLIQPLVENAVIHGSGNKLKPCTIEVFAEYGVNKDTIKIVVEDNGAGMSEEKLTALMKSIETGDVNSKDGKGMALYNVKKRLGFYYKGDPDKFFSIKSSENKGTTVIIEIPLAGGES